MSALQINQFDVSKLAGWNLQTYRASYTNSTGSDIDLAAGTVFGVVNSTGKLVPFNSTLKNGGQSPRAVLLSAISVANGETVTLTVVIKGSVDSSKLVFVRVGDSLDTVVGPVDNQSPQVLIGEATVRWSLIGIGIIPVASTELTAADNS